MLYWSISPFTSCESKEARASCDYLQVRELMSSERGGSEIQNDQWQCFWPRHFGQNFWSAFTNFVNWVIIMPLVHSTKRGLRVVSTVKVLNIGQIAQTCWSTWPIRSVPWSPWNLRGIPLIGIIFSKRTLTTEAAVACLQGMPVCMWKHTDHY